MNKASSSLKPCWGTHTLTLQGSLSTKPTKMLREMGYKETAVSAKDMPQER